MQLNFAAFTVKSGSHHFLEYCAIVLRLWPTLIFQLKLLLLHSQPAALSHQPAEEQGRSLLAPPAAQERQSW